MRTLPLTRRLATWATAGVFGAGALTGVVLSQTGLASADSSAPSSAGTTSSGTNRPPHPGPLHGDHLGILGRALHGDVTVLGKNNKPHDVQFRRGTASVSGDIITVASKDATSATFTKTNATKVFKDGKAAQLADVNGDQVRVLVVDGTLRRVVSGQPPRPAPGKRGMDVVTGTLTNVNGSSFTVNGKTYTLGPDARVADNGVATSLQALSGKKVHVLLGPGANSTTARAVVAGTPPRGHMRGFAPGGPPAGGPQPGDAPATAPGGSTLNG